MIYPHGGRSDLLLLNHQTMVTIHKSEGLTDQDSVVQRRRQLLEGELARYMNLLSRRADLERVIVFGSLVTGDPHSWSDIDLVIVQRTDLPFWQRLRAMRRLLQPRVGTDLLVYTPAEFEQLSGERVFFQQEILARGKVIYERSG